MNSISFKTNTEIQYSYSVDKKPNTFLNYSYSVIRNEYQWQNIRIRFLIIPIRFARSWSDYKDLTSMQAKLWNTTMLILKLLQDIWMVVFFSRENKQRWFGIVFWKENCFFWQWVKIPNDLSRMRSQLNYFFVI